MTPLPVNDGKRLRRIIYMVDAPFSQRDYERFGIATLARNGFDVEVWDLSQALYPQLAQKEFPAGPIEYKGLRRFVKKEEAWEEIIRLKGDCLIISILEYSLKNFPVFKAITKADVPYALFVMGPNPFQSRGVAERILAMAKDFDSWRLAESLWARIPIQLLGIRPASLLLIAGGEIACCPQGLTDRQTDSLWIHALDYDQYLQRPKNPPPGDPKLGVFIDQYLPFHPDGLTMSYAPCALADEYYPLLRRCFDHLERDHSCRIVIAAHPRSRYEEHPEYFGGRTAIRGKTLELVGQAGFILSHFSGALNWAVLQHKPIIFLSTNRLRHSFETHFIEEYATQLEKASVNLDADYRIDLPKELRMKDSVFENFRRRYIKKDGTPELPFWQAVSDYLKKWRPCRPDLP